MRLSLLSSHLLPFAVSPLCPLTFMFASLSCTRLPRCLLLCRKHITDMMLYLTDMMLYVSDIMLCVAGTMLTDCFDRLWSQVQSHSVDRPDWWDSSQQLTHLQEEVWKEPDILRPSGCSKVRVQGIARLLLIIPFCRGKTEITVAKRNTGCQQTWRDRANNVYREKWVTASRATGNSWRNTFRPCRTVMLLLATPVLQPQSQWGRMFPFKKDVSPWKVWSNEFSLLKQRCTKGRFCCYSWWELYHSQNHVWFSSGWKTKKCLYYYT